MHVYFSGIGGSGLAPLAQIALDVGFTVSGSDLQKNKNIQNLQAHLYRLNLEQTTEKIAKTHQDQNIDWLVYTSALPTDHPELLFAQKQGIKTSKRDQFLNFLLQKQNLQLIAVSGTHGKTTTTAMLVWLFKQFNYPVSYLIGSNIPFGQSGQFRPQSSYFVLECDEFDRNFLHYKPHYAIIPSLDYDHPDTYPTLEEYQQAFALFLSSVQTAAYLYQTTWQVLAPWLKQKPDCDLYSIAKSTYLDRKIQTLLPLPGKHNRQNAYLAALCFWQLNKLNSTLQENILEKQVESIFKKTTKSKLPNGKDFLFKDICQKLLMFPGTERRFEKLAPNLYSDYAHHPSEIKAVLQLAREVLNQKQRQKAKNG